MHYKVIASDREVRRVLANEPFKPAIDGWFVPDAQWIEIRNAISDKIRDLEPK